MMTMGCYRAASCSIALLAGALLCAAILVSDVAASPLPTRENAPYTATVFAHPEYLEAVAKELEKEGSAMMPAHATWWIRYQQKMQNDPMYQRDTSMHGNLDQIGGGNLLRRNLDAIGGGNLVKRNLDPIGGGNLLRSIQLQEPPAASRDRPYLYY